MVRLLFLGFVVVCVFDPADTVLRAKVPLFIALWVATLLRMPTIADKAELLTKPAIYVALFIAIPVYSLLRFDLISGHLPPQGFSLLKGYLLISLVIVLVVNRVDLVPQLSTVLAVLALFVIIVFILIQLDYSGMYNALQPLGLSLGLFYLDERRYGDFVLLQTFFATSPMLAISIAYYFDRAMSETNVRRRMLLFALTAVNIAGMFLAGTRNNMFVSLLLPFVLWPLYTRKPAVNALLSLGGLVLLALPFAGYITAFLDPAEFANNIKLVTVRDYLQIFSDHATLWFGLGLGVNYDWTARGQFAMTELTYFEIVRSFGLLGGIIMFGLLSLPLVSAILAPTSRRDKALAAAYFLYLVMCFSNPMLFSSMGILILSAVVANIFQTRDNEPRTVKREFA
jgi:hypothetical protein